MSALPAAVVPDHDCLFAVQTGCCVYCGKVRTPTAGLDLSPAIWRVDALHCPRCGQALPEAKQCQALTNIGRFFVPLGKPCAYRARHVFNGWVLCGPHFRLIAIQEAAHV